MEILALRQHQHENPRQTIFGPIREIGGTLFDVKLGKTVAFAPSDIVRTVDGRMYIVSEWSDKREPPTVSRKMERQLATGAVKVWINYAP